MPFQNRVTPFGEIVPIDQRGTFIVNRGIIHDPATKTLTGRRWTTKAWLICTCDYKGRRREIMGGRSWTELFFLDEAIALAAGHRPCFFCRRQAAEAFRLAWSATTDRKHLAPAMDAGPDPATAPSSTPRSMQYSNGRNIPQRRHAFRQSRKGRS